MGIDLPSEYRIRCKQGYAMLEYEKNTYRLLFICIGMFVVFAVFTDGIITSTRGFLSLQLQAARLISDFTVTGGSGGALLNAAIMGLLSLGLVRISGVRLSGPTVAATFTIMGFSLFGKTPFNALPIILGVFIASRVARKSFGSYLLMALFGTALGPLVSYLAFESGLTGPGMLVLAIAAGTVTGFILPSLAMAMLRMHEGFNLYNIGLTCGFFGLFAASIIEGTQGNLSVSIIWNTEPRLELTILVPILSLLFIIWGTVSDGRKLGKNLKALLKLSGRLPSDFMESVSPGAALFNAGVLGLAGWTYLYLVGADINGPVIGGLMTVMGFATFGKHVRNAWPLSAGVILATLVFGKSLTAPGPVLALLFATTLAPLAGEFGILVGLSAGFIHLLVVERTAAWHGGLDLYNNGFAGGLTATLFVAVIQWVKTIKNR